jgi:hypothetical protein
MPRFMSCNNNQSAMVVNNYQHQLQPDTFEQTVYYLIEHKLDLSAFHSKYRNEATYRLAYETAILLKKNLEVFPRALTAMSALSEEIPMHAEIHLSRSSQRFQSAGAFSCRKQNLPSYTNYTKLRVDDLNGKQTCSHGISGVELICGIY